MACGLSCINIFSTDGGHHGTEDQSLLHKNWAVCGWRQQAVCVCVWMDGWLMCAVPRPSSTVVIRMSHCGQSRAVESLLSLWFVQGSRSVWTDSAKADWPWVMYHSGEESYSAELTGVRQCSLENICFPSFQDYSSRHVLIIRTLLHILPSKEQTDV